MDNFKSYGQDKVFDFDYDSLTRAQESETRRLLEYLELPWEEACLSPEDNPRSVHTASTVQVRHKVYQHSSTAWKKYERFIDGVFDHLPSHFN